MASGDTSARAAHRVDDARRRRRDRNRRHGVWFHIWQDDVRDMMGVPHLKWHDYVAAAVLSIVVLFPLVDFGPLVRRLILFLIRELNKVAPPRLSAVVAGGCWTQRPGMEVNARNR